ncbi:non-classical arabinogalactan protein 31-like [Amaranthus tricolor]|uniref:non-classical arabinogalactan protein 31-like n=1 Tax=Amaranthus tricolor TaxID=29722 RepID=UPI00258AD149|nr:non-classical arabinogalactan protein 31-like [Amaranthus tricolor]
MFNLLAFPCTSKMAFTTSFLVFACFLLVSTQVYANCPPPQPSSADIPPVYVLPESPLASPLAPADSPIYFFPEAPTAYSPSYFPDPEAPAYSPIYFPPEAPATSPVYPPPVQEPTTPPVYTPPQTPSVPYNHGFCVVECMQRCKTLSEYKGRTRVCVRLCSHCCKANKKCVPGPLTKCSAWDTIVYHGVTVKCP